MRRNLALKRVFLCAALCTVSFYVYGQYPSTCFPLGSDQCQAPSIISEGFGFFIPGGEVRNPNSEEGTYADFIRAMTSPAGYPCPAQITFLQDWHASDLDGRILFPVKFGVEVSSAKSYRWDNFVFENGACRVIGINFVDFYRERSVNCPKGYDLDASSPTFCRRVDVDPGKALCCADIAQVNAGNPINAAIGNKFQSENDYVGHGPFPLRLTRIFNSGGPNTFLPGFGNSPNLGFRWKYWRHTYDRAIAVVKSTSLTTVRAYRQDGRVLSWNLLNGQYVTESDIHDVLQPQLGPDNTQVGWSYRNTDDELEIYDLSGRLKSITNRTGLMQTLIYSDSATPANVASYAGLLVSVADPFGRQLLFTYDAQGRTTAMSDPAGGTYQYSYDANENLTAVTYPDGKVRQYSYENSNFPKALTGIMDENGQRFSTYGYDSQGRAASSVHAGGANHLDTRP
jgi:YD repeat-containing protein